MAMPGPITALAASGRWLFVAYFAVVPGRTAAEVGCVKAILAGAGGVTVDIKVRHACLPGHETHEYDASKTRDSRPSRQAATAAASCRCSRVAVSDLMLDRFLTRLLASLLLQAPGQDYAHIHMINAMETTVVGEQPCLFTAGGDGLIKMWSPDAAAGTYTQLGSALEGHIRGVRSLFFDDSTGYLYSGCDDGSIKVWRLRDASPVCAHTIIPPPRADAAPAVPGGGFAAAIAAAGGAGAVAAAVPGAPAAGSRLTTTSHTTAIIGLTQLDLPHASGTFQILVSAAADGSVKLWNVANPEEPRLLPGELAPTVHSAPHGAAAHGAHHRQRTATAMTVQQTEVAPGSPTVIVGFSDGSILGYDIGEGSPVHDWTMANLSNGHRAAVRELWCLDTSMNELISVGDDGKLLVYKGNVEADGLGAGAAPAYGAAPAFGAAPAAAPGYGAYGAPAPAAYGTGIAPAGDFGSGTGPGGW